MANATASDVSVNDLSLNGAPMPRNVRDAITTTMLTQTIAGASTVELDLHDPHRSLLLSGVADARTTVGLDDLKFEVVAASKQGNILSVTSEDYAVARLRRHRDVAKAAVGTTSRVQFCRRLITHAEPWIVVDGPDEGPTILEEIAVGTTTDSSDVSPVDTQTGGDLSADQVAQLAYTAGWRGNDLTVAVAVAHAESGFNPTDVGHDSNGTKDWGVWQINSVHGYSRSDMFDPTKNAAAGYRLWKATQGEPNGGWHQWSTFNNSKYKQYLREAGIAANSVTANTDPTDTTTTSKPEDYWTAIQRIMSVINWRVFARRGHIVIAPDSWLLKQPGLTISEDTDGVDDIDFDIDRGRKVSNVTITCRAKRWATLPGEPVIVTGLGPADDTWLLSEITRPLSSESATVTLIKRQKALPEPSADSGDGGANIRGAKQDPLNIADAKGGVRAYVEFALAQRGKPYKWGGNGPHAWDCSGLVVGATAAGGHKIPARTAATQFLACRADQREISVQHGMQTCGALLFEAGTDGTSTTPGHVAISLGNGQTMEAHSSAEGCGVFSATEGRDWTYAGLPPGFEIDNF